MHANIDLFIPDQISALEAQARTSHLGIGAHQDGLRIKAFHGIATCFGQDNAWFSGIICTDGGGSARSGAFAGKTTSICKRSVRMSSAVAAEIGQYSEVGQLGFTSAVP